jgi:hypothetical protein
MVTIVLGSQWGDEGMTDHFFANAPTQLINTSLIAFLLQAKERLPIIYLKMRHSVAVRPVDIVSLLSLTYSLSALF